METDSCKDYLKNQILTAIKTVLSTMKQSSAILVTDDKTTMILDSCLKVYQLNELGIGALVNVKYSRERLKVPPIYFLSPTIESINGVINDWEDPDKPQYATSVHLLFCSSISSEGMELLKKSKLRRYLKTFQEVFCDFYALESKLYHFNRPDAFHSLYLYKKFDEEFRQTAENLFSVCVSFREEPYIRFAKDSERAVGLAQMFKDFFAKKRMLMKTFRPRNKRATLLILDRTQDPVAPLLHEMTYQSMIKDLISGENRYLNLPKEEDTKEDDEKSAGNKQVQFYFADDPLWKDFRHKHMSQVCSDIREKFQTFKDTNVIARQQAEQAMNQNLRKAVTDLPKYKQMSKSFNFHFQITNMIVQFHKQMELAKITEIEQCMVTGLDDKGKSVKTSTIQSALLDIFRDPTTSITTKIRLLLAYIISQDGISEKMREDLFTASNLSAADAEVIYHLTTLDVKVRAEGKKTKKSPYYKEMQNRAKELAKANINRFEPLISILLKKLGEDKLSEEDFPYCGPEPQSRSLVSSFGGRSLRKKGKLENKEAPRIIIFMIGGVCYSEVRQCYLLGEELNREIFIGSTHILTPNEYIKLLRGKPAKKVN